MKSILYPGLFWALSFGITNCNDSGFKSKNTIAPPSPVAEPEKPDPTSSGDDKSKRLGNGDVNPETPKAEPKPSNEGPKTDDLTKQDPKDEKPGSSGFYSCLNNYDKDVTPIRVDVFAVAENFEKAFKEIEADPNCNHACQAPKKAQLLVLANENKMATFKSPRLTQFCMTHYDVEWRIFNEGFPKNDGSGKTLDKTEWFAFNSWAYLNVEKDGDYTFSALVDDGSRVFVDGVEVINNDGVHITWPLDDAQNNHTRSIKLTTAGNPHKIQVIYFQGPRDYIAFQLYWKTPGKDKWKIVPPSAFSFWEGKEENNIIP